jgi:predicted nucleic acid-binding protein
MKIFVDTSAWCALVDEKDKNHVKATGMLNRINENGHTLLTSDYIFDETITLFRFKLGYSIALKFGEGLLASKVCQLLEIDKNVRDKAWDIFERYSDKKFSFTDCASFAIMNVLGIKTAFSFDSHFKQYGLSLFHD